MRHRHDADKQTNKCIVMWRSWMSTAQSRVRTTKSKKFKHPVFGWLWQLDHYNLYYKCIRWYRCHYRYVRRCRTNYCGHCKRVSIQLLRCCCGIDFGHNDDSYSLVRFHNDDSTSSHNWIAWWILHIIRNLFVAWCPSILESNAVSISVVLVVVF